MTNFPGLCRTQNFVFYLDGLTLKFLSKLYLRNSQTMHQMNRTNQLRMLWFFSVLWEKNEVEKEKGGKQENLFILLEKLNIYTNL